MKWILLIYSISYGFNSSVSVIEFNSKKSCEAAKEKIITYDIQTKRDAIRKDKTGCIEVPR